MPKLKCVSCKDRFDAETMIKLPIGNVHSVECATSYARAKQEKATARKLAKAKSAQKKKDAKQKRDFYDNDIKTRKKAVKTACHAYIRERDRGLPCICCGRALGAKYDAGHWQESGNNSSLRYHEDNIHAQNVHCNQYKGGDSDDYEGRLRLKIGDERVDYLLSNKGGIVKRTAQDYKDIENHYKEKLKALLITNAD